MSHRLAGQVSALVLAASTVLSGCLPADQAAGPDSPADLARQRAFTAAAAEYGVPKAVLLGLSYLESRWNFHDGMPSVSAGYGPMHLTDAGAAGVGSRHARHVEDARGDGARPELRPVIPPTTTTPPPLRTVDLAAQLTGLDERTLRTDPAQNIRGGAAVLAHYQRQLGLPSNDAAGWYSAVARYGGAAANASGSAFADEVFATINSGVARVADDGQRVRLAAHPDLTPAKAELQPANLRETSSGDTECPPELSCEWHPAPYQQLADGGYGNHDQANRPHDQDIDYIVIHDTEGYWADVQELVQDPAYTSWHYSLRSSDGHIAQHVRTEDVAWHAGNWYVNAHSVGLEHEGFAAQGTWYTEAMYRSSAKLVRYLADRYDIPLDRAHILGHDNVPGTIPENVAGMHWDPGPYWDWAHYFNLLGAPFGDGSTNQSAGLVTINPDYASNQPRFTGCTEAGEPCPAHGSTSVVLRTEPRADAPLLTDIGLHPDGAPSTMNISDIGSRAETGQKYAVADRKGDWTAIWYLGQKGWFHSPVDAPTAVPAQGKVVTPKPGRESVPVYGRAYPEPEAYPADLEPQPVVPLQYTLPAGQRYSVGLRTRADYYSATTFDVDEHVVVQGKTRYLQIQFGHRVAYVKASDVQVLRAPQ